MVGAEPKDVRGMDLEASRKALSSSSTATRTAYLHSIDERLSNKGPWQHEHNQWAILTSALYRNRAVVISNSTGTYFHHIFLLPRPKLSTPR